MAKSALQLIDHAREFHHRLSEFYAKLKEVAEKARVKMLLDYMTEERMLVRNALEIEEL